MPRYLAVDRKGRPIAILLAEALDHADLYGLRKLANYSGVQSVPDDFEDDVDADIREAFSDLGLSEAAAAIAALGRPGSAAALPVITVPYQEVSSAFRRPNPAASSPGLARINAAIARGDAAEVQRLAATGRGVASATRSFTEHRPAAESASQVAIELRETFMELGLSEAGAALAAEGRT